MRLSMKLADLLRRLFAPRTPPVRAEELPDIREVGDEQETDPFNPFPNPVELEIRDVLDLHSIPPRETGVVVEEYLYQARLVGFRQVRIIHGKGIGVQREIVRSILARTPFVQHYADAPLEAGGWGATIARLLLIHEQEQG